MIDSTRFEKLVGKHFRFLTREFGYESRPVRSSTWLTSVVFKRAPFAVEVRHEPREGSIFCFVIEVGSGDPPSYLESRSHWLYLKEILWVKAPEEASALGALRQRGQTKDAVDEFLGEVARLLRAFGSDILLGDKRRFASVKRQAEKVLQRKAMNLRLPDPSEDRR